MHKIYFKQLFSAIFVAMIVVVYSMPHAVLAATDASFSLSPTSGSYQVGNTISFAISETSAAGDNVDAVEADLTYDSSRLQYQSTSLTGPFTLCAKNSGGGGSVSIACASSSTVSGTQAVATVTFKVLATGTATVSMASTSDIDNTSGTSVFNGTLPSASYSLSAATSSSSSSNGNSSSAAAPSCTAQAPSSAPYLYEIDVTNTTATLYFSPAGSPYDSHYISFGQGQNSEGYGANFSTGRSTGALYYTVRQLSPSIVYTFKVRGGNGCKPGPWSNTLTILTLPWGSHYIKKYFSDQQAPIVQATITSWYQQATHYVSQHLPKVPDTGSSALKKHIKVAPKPTATAHVTSPTTAQQTQIQQPVSQPFHPTIKKTSSPSLWSDITNFVSGIFHAL